jgi:hypothetical protein
MKNGVDFRTVGWPQAAIIFLKGKSYHSLATSIADIGNTLQFNSRLVMYIWCGQWVASPSLGSAGQTVKMVAYGIGMVGLIANAVIYLHVAAKYLFVRILRN